MFDLEKSILEWRQQMRAAGIRTSVPLEELEVHLRDDFDRLLRSGMSEETAFQISARNLGQPPALKSEFKKNGTLAGKKAPIATLVFGVAMILRVLYRHHITGPVWKNDQLGWILFVLIISFWAVNTLFFDFKLGEVREVRLWKLVGVTFSIFAVWVSLLPVLQIFIVPKFYAAFGTTSLILILAAALTSLLSVFGWQSCRGILPVIRSRRTRTIIGIGCCVAGHGLIALCLWGYVMPRMGHFRTSPFYVSMAWIWTAMAILGGAGYGLTEAARKETTTTN